MSLILQHLQPAVARPSGPRSFWGLALFLSLCLAPAPAEARDPFARQQLKRQRPAQAFDKEAWQVVMTAQEVSVGLLKPVGGTFGATDIEGSGRTPSKRRVRGLRKQLYRRAYGPQTDLCGFVPNVVVSFEKDKEVVQLLIVLGGCTNMMLHGDDGVSRVYNIAPLRRRLLKLLRRLYPKNRLFRG